MPWEMTAFVAFWVRGFQIPAAKKIEIVGTRDPIAKKNSESRVVTGI